MPAQQGRQHVQHGQVDPEADHADDGETQELAPQEPVDQGHRCLFHAAGDGARAGWEMGVMGGRRWEAKDGKHRAVDDRPSARRT